MSLLLKALEKSEGEEAEQPSRSEHEGGSPASPSEGPSPSPAAAPGGIRLGGGGSKLGSALAGSKKAKSAKDIVSAYDKGEGEEDGKEDDEESRQRILLQLQRKAQIRNAVLAAVTLVVAGGGWYAYDRFFAKQEAQITVSPSGEGTERARDADVGDAEVVFLPLAEPIYDIQENILAASTAPTSSGSDSDSQENVVGTVNSLVEKILEEELRKARAASAAGDANTAASIELERLEAESLAEELGSLLERDIGSDVPLENSRGDVASRLQELSKKAHRERGQLVVSQKVAAALEAADKEEAAAGENSKKEGQEAKRVSSAQAITPQQISRKSSDLSSKMEEGVALYKAGDLAGSELAFRSILAIEPRNSNALVGLAKIYSARGNNRLAGATLLKASEYSPENPVVISELISLQAATTLNIIPTELINKLLADTNDKAVQSKLLFVLGLNESKKKNWLLAKRNFLNAYNLNPANPDIAFNLAVMHDYLGESAEAANMYRAALANSRSAPSSFNKQVARDRADTLEN